MVIKNISRRKFCSALGAAGIALSAGLVLPEICTPNQSSDLSGLSKDYSIVETIDNEEDIASLERIVSEGVDGPSHIYTFNQNTIPRNFHLEIVYPMTYSGSNNESSYNLTSGEFGSTFLLNDEGFFISAFHVLKHHITDKNNDKPGLVLICSPQTGEIKDSRILSYSEKCDIVLGKVNNPNKLECSAINLTGKSSFLEGEQVWAGAYSNKDYISGKLCSEAVHAYCENRKFSPTQNLGGSQLVVEIMNKEGIFNEEWGYVVNRNFLYGDSGIPFFTSDNNLAGILTSSGEVNYTNGLKKGIAVFSGPVSIRNLIDNFIRECKK
jgi:hypothetical protein